VAKAEGGTRERKKRATRAQLEEAAYSLFARQGYDATTVDEISDAANVSPRTFFRYFATKEDVVFGDTAENLEALRHAMEHGPGGDAEVVASGILVFSEMIEDRRDTMLERQQLVRDNPTLQGRVLLLEHAWAAAMATMLAERNGSAVPTFAQHVLAECAISALSSAVKEWHATGAVEPLPSFTRRALDTLGSNLHARD
jgi:AcrR family transcriptional regulator